MPPTLFYDRRQVLGTIAGKLSGLSAQSVSIVGERRIGKSSLLLHLKNSLVDQLPPPHHYLVIYLDLMKAYCHSQKGLMRVLRRELTQSWREPWPKNEDGDLIAFDFALEDLQAEGVRLILCLDEVENLTKRPAEFNDLLEDWRAGGSMGQMALITASTQPLADLCQAGGLISPFYNIFSQAHLGLLPAADWRALVTDHMAVTEADLAFIETIAGGHPFYTQMAAGHLWQARAQGAVTHQSLTAELARQMAPHLRGLWQKLTAAERETLRRLATSPGGDINTRISAALTRRGLITEGRVFSIVFAEMIQDECTGSVT